VKKSNQVITRLLDAALLAGLIFGNADAKIFVFRMVSIMVILMFVGVLTMTPDSAEKIQGGSLVKKALGILIRVLYIAALIYAGFPTLAAMYATAALFIRISAEAKLSPQVAK